MQASAFVIERFSHSHLQNVSLPLLLAYLIFWIRVCISHTGSLTSVAPIQRSRGGESSHPITSLKNEQSRWHAVTIENVYIYIWFALDIICTISKVYNCKCACDHTALCRWRWAFVSERLAQSPYTKLFCIQIVHLVDYTSRGHLIDARRCALQPLHYKRSRTNMPWESYADTMAWSLGARCGAESTLHYENKHR